MTPSGSMKWGHLQLGGFCGINARSPMFGRTIWVSNFSARIEVASQGRIANVLGDDATCTMSDNLSRWVQPKSAQELLGPLVRGVCGMRVAGKIDSRIKKV
jgi:hypothetical protein